MKGSFLAETLPEEGNQERKGSTLYPGGQWTPFFRAKMRAMPFLGILGAKW